MDRLTTMTDPLQGQKLWNRKREGKSSVGGTVNSLMSIVDILRDAIVLVCFKAQIAKQHHAMPHHATPCHTTPCHIKPHHTTPHHTAPPVNGRDEDSTGYRAQYSKQNGSTSVVVVFCCYFFAVFFHYLFLFVFFK